MSLDVPPNRPQGRPKSPIPKSQTPLCPQAGISNKSGEKSRTRLQRCSGQKRRSAPPLQVSPARLPLVNPQSPNHAPGARKRESCPSPPKGGEGARRADEGGIRVPTTYRVPHQKPAVRERECRSRSKCHSPTTRARTKTPCASPAVMRGASATSFGGRDAFGGTRTWGRHVPCQPQAMGDKSCRLGWQSPRGHEERRTWRHETDDNRTHVVQTGSAYSRVLHGRSNPVPVLHSVIQHVPERAQTWIVSFSTEGGRRCPKGG